MNLVLGFGAVGLALLVFGVGAPCTAKLEKAEPPAALSIAHRKLFDPEALGVCAGGEPVMRVWFRTEIPVQATAAQFKRGLTYRQIPEGTLVGAVEFPKPFVDYRKQRLPAGTYTLRFALQPDTGDHTDTSPHPEFCLLSPAAEDTSAQPMEVKRLIELSSKVNEGRHPAVFLLWPSNEPASGVQVLDKGNGVRVAAVRRTVVSGGRKAHLGFAVTVAGWRMQ
jgi:hypothetical protein